MHSAGNAANFTFCDGVPQGISPGALASTFTSFQRNSTRKAPARFNQFKALAGGSTIRRSPIRTLQTAPWRGTASCS